MAQPWDDLKLLFPDNSEGLISAADMRAQVDTLELVDSENTKGQSAQRVIVNPEDASDIADVVASITDAASNNRYLITVNPGEHVTKPVQMKPYIYIIGTAKDGAIISANAVTDTVFTMTDQSTIENLIVNGASSGIAFLMNVSGHSHWENGGCTNCAIGVKVDHVDAEVLASINWNNTNGTGYLVTNGVLHLLEAIVLQVATFSNIVHITGPNSLATIHKIISFSPNVTNAVLVEDGARVVANGLNISNATVGVTVSGDSEIVIKSSKVVFCGTGLSLPNVVGNPKVEASGFSIVNNTVDASILTPNATILGKYTADLSNSVAVEGVTFVSLVIDTTPGDEGTQIKGDLKVGTPLNPTESCFGEGDSYSSPTTALFYEWDGSSYTDITGILASPTGSLWTWPNLLTDSALYMASTISKDGDYLKVPGFKANIITLSTFVGDSPFVIEYWNGGSWVDVKHMTTDSYGDYSSHGLNLFSSEGKHQTRLNALLPDKVWVKSDPMLDGTEYYWIRIRTVSAILTAPVLEQVKLHSNRTEINEDGYIEFFGSGRPIKALPWDAAVMEGTNIDPTKDGDVYLYDGIDRGMTKNKFETNKVQRVGFTTYLPQDMDTSSPIKMYWSVISSVDGNGTSTWNIRWGSSTDGDLVSLSPTVTIAPNLTQVIGVIPTGLTQTTFQVDMDVSNLVPSSDLNSGDILWITIERDGVDDGNVAHMVMINVSPLYATHVLGGHVG